MQSNDIILPSHKATQRSPFQRQAGQAPSPENQQLQWRKRLILAAVIVFVLLVIAGICGLIVNLVNSATVEVVVAPTDATITIDGHEVDNGNHRMQPGTYDYTVERDGFVAAAGTIEVSNDAPAKLYVCLDTTEATAGWYDDDSTADADACQQVLDYQMFENEQAWLDTDPILRVIPYHSYDKGFNIDYAVDEAGGFTVSITPLSCNAQRADSLYEAALDYLRSQDIDPDDYVITRKNGCE